MLSAREQKILACQQYTKEREFAKDANGNPYKLPLSAVVAYLNGWDDAIKLMERQDV